MVDLRGMLYSINPGTMLLGLAFIIFYVLIQFLLSKSMKDKRTSAIISLCVSLLAVYGINRMNWDLSGIALNIGLSEETIYTVVPIVILLGLIFMIWKAGLPITLMAFGAILIAASFFVYEKTFLLFLGIFILVIGIYLFSRKHIDSGALGPPGKIRQSRLWILAILLIIVSIIAILKGNITLIIMGFAALILGIIILLVKILKKY